MDEKDKDKFLEDFKKADIQKKLDMWFYALDQEGLWEDIMDEMSKLARIQLMKSGVKSVAAEK